MIYVLVNPVAGRGRALKWQKAVCEELSQRGQAYKVLHTLHSGHAKDLAIQAVQEGAERIVMISGDGTLAAMTEGLKDTGVPVCILPGGTGNDVSRVLGVPRTPKEAVDVLLGGEQRNINVGRIDGKCFLNIVGVGFDVDIVLEAEKVKKYLRGLPAYLVALVRALVNYQGKRLTVIADGVKREINAILVAVANGRYFGGGMMVAPKADMEDGLLDLCLIQSVSRLQVLRLLPMFITGKHIELPVTEYIRAREVSIEGEGLTAQVDGEIIRPSSLQLSLDGSLAVLVPHR